MKTVLITGVSRGIGKALAERFLQNGDFVVGTSTKGTSDWTHENLTVLKLDLSKSESIEECAEQIIAFGKKIDILINNAGIWSGAEDDPVLRIKDLRKTLEVNLFGTADFTDRVLPLVNDGGHIINISSRAGSLSYVHDAEYPDYKISKAALNMFTRMLAIRFKDKITVSSVHPGWVKTDMGGSDADMEPKEAAEHIFKLAYTPVETGQFWFKGEKFPW
ncbi:MAG: hypothetical protein QG633_470 [Patescibacteria group bacterium]|jgi:NAD(P)-dependent dehydrogenase (short-subunit alcohol dehydrogenase family)|nr:hypothetical protein [Patescibacteria group bacterium]